MKAIQLDPATILFYKIEANDKAIDKAIALSQQNLNGYSSKAFLLRDLNKTDRSIAYSIKCFTTLLKCTKNQELIRSTSDRQKLLNQILQFINQFSKKKPIYGAFFI